MPSDDRPRPSLDSAPGTSAAAQDEPRGWVVRLGHYLRIFGGRGDAGQPEHRAYIDHLAEMAKEKEFEREDAEVRALSEEDDHAVA